MAYLAISFRGCAEYVHEVRTWTAKALGNVAGADVVVFVASELATNAVRHAAGGEPGGTFSLHLATFADRWLVRVDDQGGPSGPEVLKVEQEGETGRGLALVAMLSASWGVLGDQYARGVWAEISRPREESTA
jgi:anti-sigma regulatory factor (Ser/Thr protein kinase)